MDSRIVGSWNVVEEGSEFIEWNELDTIELCEIEREGNRYERLS